MNARSLRSLTLLIFLANNTLCTKSPQGQFSSANFSGPSITKELFDYIRTLLPKGKTILELGSGWASGQLSKYYTVYSIEHNKKWLHQYHTNYIYAPIKNSWYDTSVLEKKLPKAYDLILVDGPPGHFGRDGFYKNLHLFNTNVPIIIDDINREIEYNLYQTLAHELNCTHEVIDHNGRPFALLLPK